MRVLVAEDDALIAMMLCDALIDGGHTVLGPAVTIADALSLCGAASPDLAVLDINLAQGDKGTDLAHLLFLRWGVWSLFASGQADEARQAKDVALGYIAKPYDPDLVLRSVEIVRLALDGQVLPPPPEGLEWFR